MSDDDFQLEPPRPPRQVRPLEPLHSMLHDAPLSAVEYLHHEWSRIDSEKQLDELLPDLGITRKRAIEQVWLVLSQRKTDQG